MGVLNRGTGFLDRVEGPGIISSGSNTRQYLDFNTSSVLVTASTTLATATAYKLKVKFRLDDFAGNQGLFGVGASGATRLEMLAAAKDIRWRVNSGTFIQTAQDLILGTNYEITVEDPLGDGTVAITVDNLDTGAQHATAAGTTNSTQFAGAVGLGATTSTGGSRFSGRIWDTTWDELGSPVHAWAVDEGSGTAIADSVGALPGVLTLNSGVWEAGPKL